MDADEFRNRIARALLVPSVEIDTMRGLFSACDGVECVSKISHAPLLQFLESKGSSAVWTHYHVVEFVKRELGW